MPMPEVKQSVRRLAGRTSLAIALVMAQTTALVAQAPSEGRKVKVEKGQLLEMELVAPISSAAATVGQQVFFRLTEPLEADGETVLPAGSELTGRITKAERAGPNCRPGKLEWQLDDAKTSEGSTIPLRPAFAIHERKSGKLVELNPPPSSREKMKKALLAPLIAAGVVMSLPAVLPLIATEKEPACTDQGADRSYKAGSISHAAVRGSVRVTVAGKNGAGQADSAAATAP